MIIVLGDAFVDKYTVGNVRGLSAEAPIPILDVTEEFAIPGGAANVAQNLFNFGADVAMLQPEGQNYPIKNRLLDQDGHQLARFDLNDYCIPYSRADLLDLLEADAIVVSDYGKGSISEEVVNVLRNVKIPLYVDTKGDPSAWVGSNAVLFPNKAEYEKYKEAYDWFPQVIVKLSEEGVIYLEYGRAMEHVRSVAKFAKCVNGAGDTVMAAFITAQLGLNYNLFNTLNFAMAAAGIVVEQSFTKRTVELEEVLDRVDKEFNNEVQFGVQSTGGPSNSSPISLSILSLSSGQEDFDSPSPSRPVSTDGIGNPAGYNADVPAALGLEEAWEIFRRQGLGDDRSNSRPTN